MFRWEMDDQHCACTFSSTYTQMERAVTMCRTFLSPDNKSESDNAVLALRELLVNAIEHGNQANENLMVHTAIERLAPERFRIEVRDEGQGFVLDKQKFATMPGAKEIRSRGLAIVHSLCDDVTSVPAKATVIALVTMDQPVAIRVQKESERWIVTPGGDLSAANADVFRSVLLDWLAAETPSCILDLTSVRTMDSICLSVLLSLARELQIKGHVGRIKMQGVQPGLRTLFQLTQIHRLFPHA